MDSQKQIMSCATYCGLIKDSLSSYTIICMFGIDCYTANVIINIS